MSKQFKIRLLPHKKEIKKYRELIVTDIQYKFREARGAWDDFLLLLVWDLTVKIEHFPSHDHHFRFSVINYPILYKDYRLFAAAKHRCIYPLENGIWGRVNEPLDPPT